MGVGVGVGCSAKSQKCYFPDVLRESPDGCFGESPNTGIYRAGDLFGGQNGVKVTQWGFQEELAASSLKPAQKKTGVGFETWHFGKQLGIVSGHGFTLGWWKQNRVFPAHFRSKKRVGQNCFSKPFVVALLMDNQEVV